MKIVIFSRNIRIHDNKVLDYALKKNNIDELKFIQYINPNELTSRTKKFYKSHVDNLSKAIKYFFKKKLHKTNKINFLSNVSEIYCMKDYTPFYCSDIKQILHKKDIKINEINDNTIIPDLDQIRWYKVFTPFYNKYNKQKFTVSTKNSIFHHHNNKVNEFSRYLRFGIISPRELWNSTHLKNIDNIRRNLIWRDFYYMCGYHRPDIFKFNNFSSGNLPNTPKYKKYPPGQKKWNKFNQLKWDKFIAGNTKFNGLNAIIKTLNRTGFIENRDRMMVVSYVVYTLGYHWKYGEQYFKKQLIDYDPIINNLNWQYTAGTFSSSFRFPLKVT